MSGEGPLSRDLVYNAPTSLTASQLLERCSLADKDDAGKPRPATDDALGEDRQSMSNSLSLFFSQMHGMPNSGDLAALMAQQVQLQGELSCCQIAVRSVLFCCIAVLFKLSSL